MKDRLQKILSARGICSRRKAEAYIAAGHVSVNGAIAQLGDSADADLDEILLDGRPLPSAGEFVYIMLHKPAGLVSATEDAREETVLSLLPERYQKLGLFPAGRLDKDTEGLLLMTNDGPLAHRLLAPKYHVDKVYYVEVDGVLDESDCAAVAEGMTLGDGYVCLPGRLEPLEGGRSAHITIHEGKYHQVKRMLAARGKPVIYLKRLKFGPLELDPGLPKGGWRALTEGEISALFRQ